MHSVPYDEMCASQPSLALAQCCPTFEQKSPPPPSPRAPRSPSNPRSPGVPRSPRSPSVPRSPRSPAVPRSPRSPSVPRSPRSPGVPRSPRSPAVPRSPRSPAVPRSPRSPAIPRSPRSPAIPRSPRSPGIPRSPAAPPPPCETCWVWEITGTPLNIFTTAGGAETAACTAARANLEEIFGRFTELDLILSGFDQVSCSVSGHASRAWWSVLCSLLLYVAVVPGGPPNLCLCSVLGVPQATSACTCTTTTTTTSALVPMPVSCMWTPLNCLEISMQPPTPRMFWPCPLQSNSVKICGAFRSTSAAQDAITEAGGAELLYKSVFTDSCSGIYSGRTRRLTATNPAGVTDLTCGTTFEENCRTESPPPPRDFPYCE